MGKQWWQCGNGGSDVFFWEKFCVSYRGGGGDGDASELTGYGGRISC